jgi:antitoxin component of MazEF toxin-antitoxin module
MRVKLRKIGNSLGVLLPKEAITGYNAGDEIDIEVITGAKETQDTPLVITPALEVFEKPDFNTEFCKTHPGSRKGTCGCE